MMQDYKSILQQPSYENLANRSQMIWSQADPGQINSEQQIQFIGNKPQSTELFFNLRDQGIFFDTNALNFSDLKIAINHHQFLDLKISNQSQYFINLQCMSSNDQAEYLQKILKYMNTVQLLRSHSYQYYISLDISPSLYIPIGLNCTNVTDMSISKQLDMLEKGKYMCRWYLVEYKISFTQVYQLIKGMIGNGTEKPPNFDKKECIKNQINSEQDKDYIKVNAISGAHLQYIFTRINDQKVKMPEYQSPVVLQKLNTTSSVALQDQVNRYNQKQDSQQYISKLLKNQLAADEPKKVACLEKQGVEQFYFMLDLYLSLNNSQVSKSQSQKSNNVNRKYLQAPNSSISNQTNHNAAISQEFVNSTQSPNSLTSEQSFNTTQLQSPSTQSGSNNTSNNQIIAQNSTFTQNLSNTSSTQIVSPTIGSGARNSASPLSPEDIQIRQKQQEEIDKENRKNGIFHTELDYPMTPHGRNNYTYYDPSVPLPPLNYTVNESSKYWVLCDPMYVKNCPNPGTAMNPIMTNWIIDQDSDHCYWCDYELNQPHGIICPPISTHHNPFKPVRRISIDRLGCEFPKILNDPIIEGPTHGQRMRNSQSQTTPLPNLMDNGRVKDSQRESQPSQPSTSSIPLNASNVQYDQQLVPQSIVSTPIASDRDIIEGGSQQPTISKSPPTVKPVEPSQVSALESSLPNMQLQYAPQEVQSMIPRTNENLNQQSDSNSNSNQFPLSSNNPKTQQDVRSNSPVSISKEPQRVPRQDTLQVINPDFNLAPDTNSVKLEVQAPIFSYFKGNDKGKEKQALTQSANPLSEIFSIMELPKVTDAQSIVKDSTTPIDNSQQPDNHIDRETIQSINNGPIQFAKDVSEMDFIIGGQISSTKKLTTYGKQILNQALEEGQDYKSSGMIDNKNEITPFSYKILEQSLNQGDDYFYTSGTTTSDGILTPYGQQLLEKSFKQGERLDSSSLIGPEGKLSTKGYQTLREQIHQDAQAEGLVTDDGKITTDGLKYLKRAITDGEDLVVSEILDKNGKLTPYGYRILNQGKIEIYKDYAISGEITYDGKLTPYGKSILPKDIKNFSFIQRQLLNNFDDDLRKYGITSKEDKLTPYGFKVLRHSINGVNKQYVNSGIITEEGTLTSKGELILSKSLLPGQTLESAGITDKSGLLQPVGYSLLRKQLFTTGSQLQSDLESDQDGNLNSGSKNGHLNNLPEDSQNQQSYKLTQTLDDLETNNEIIITLNSNPTQKIMVPQQAGSDICVLDQNIHLEGISIKSTKVQMMNFIVSGTTISAKFITYNTTYNLEIMGSSLDNELDLNSNLYKTFNFSQYVKSFNDQNIKIKQSGSPLLDIMSSNGQIDESKIFGNIYSDFYINLQQKYNWNTSQPITMFQTPYDLSGIYLSAVAKQNCQFVPLLNRQSFVLLIICIVLFVILGCVSVIFFMQLQPNLALKGVHQQEHQRCFLVYGNSNEIYS